MGSSKTVLVTGPAGGIGSALTRAPAEHGQSVDLDKMEAAK
jgi:NAD(P)-dependent dehydrogenase (short-subunit alcohol dehydrogenase family)